MSTTHRSAALFPISFSVVSNSIHISLFTAFLRSGRFSVMVTMPPLRSTVMAFMGFPVAIWRCADDTEPVGYNPYRKKVVKRGDKWIFVGVAAAALGLVLWAFLG